MWLLSRQRLSRSNVRYLEADMSLTDLRMRVPRAKHSSVHCRGLGIGGFLFGLSVAAAIDGCAGRSPDGRPGAMETGSPDPGSTEVGSMPGAKTGMDSAQSGQSDSTPQGGARGSDSVQPLSWPTTAGSSSNYEVSPGTLNGGGPYGSGDGMLALAGGTQQINLRSDDGSDELKVTVTVAYNNYRADRGEMWALVPSQRGTSMPTYGVVPVRLDLTTADSRLGFAIERAELVSAEPARAAIEHVYAGPLTGTLDYDDLANLEPPCSQLRLVLDFRTDEVRARLQFESELNVVCKRWQTSAPALPWGAVLASQ
jgi:hypothetical protein